jgi:outer membrane protein TolC
LFDGGLLDAQRKAAEASYRQAVATYRQTVLTAFQQVEDDLASIRALSAQVKRLDKAVAEAREAVDVYFNQYRVGTVAFTSVVTAQATLLSGIESALTARQNLFIATVNLIGALGGGWDASRLPAIDALSAIEPPLPVPASALPAAFETAQSAR